MQRISDLVAPFIGAVRSGEIEIYNEFSLQHELGFALRSQIAGSKVRFERNVSGIFGSANGFTKREVDISILSPNSAIPTHVIELKYPRNGQHPEQMFSFCKDIAFAEELSAAGCAHAGVVIFAEDPLFYRGASEGIYGFFRGQRPLTGTIQKPTGAKDSSVHLRGEYVVRWEPILDQLAYTVIEVAQKDG